jgi:peptidyl-prolyl cis-trans isomerase A (cyclophilin A)
MLVLLIASCGKKYPEVVMKTPYGDIVIEIYEDKAPVTASNFMRYVNENRFKDAVFYRVVTPDNQPHNDVKIEVIQGGLFEDEHPDALPPIEHETTKETGIKHLDGTIRMARNEPGTASSEFFICIGDQPELDYGGRRNPDGHGFAAFGRVVKGMDVVKKIQRLPSVEQILSPKIPIKIVKRN